MPVRQILWQGRPVKCIIAGGTREIVWAPPWEDLAKFKSPVRGQYIFDAGEVYELFSAFFVVPKEMRMSTWQFRKNEIPTSFRVLSAPQWDSKKHYSSDTERRVVAYQGRFFYRVSDSERILNYEAGLAPLTKSGGVDSYWREWDKA